MSNFYGDPTSPYYGTKTTLTANQPSTSTISSSANTIYTGGDNGSNGGITYGAGSGGQYLQWTTPDAQWKEISTKKQSCSDSLLDLIKEECEN